MIEYSKVCRSSEFTFLIGEEQVQIIIHSAVAKGHSKPLDALMNNAKFKESTEGVAVLADVEPDVFTAFCEYAYTGSYTSPTVTIEETCIVILRLSLLGNIRTYLTALLYQYYLSFLDPNFVQSIDRLRIGSVKTKKQCTRLPGKLRRDFEALKYGAEPSPENGKPCALFHAKLYVFATKYLVDPLRQICLRSIHRDLSTYMLKSEDVCDLLEYVYRETGPNEPGGPSPLRHMLSLYVAARVWRYSGNKKFLELLQANGEIGADLIQLLM